MSLMHVEPIERLTSQERVVLALVAEGHSNTGIAHHLSVNVRTVETHTSRIFAKLGLEDCAAYHRRVLAALAYLNGSS
jgi:DNA-binding NarL/FixJ family response regulator